MLYKFTVGQPATFAPGVTDRNLALELDGYVDWKIQPSTSLRLRDRRAAGANPADRRTAGIRPEEDLRYGDALFSRSCLQLLGWRT